MRGKPSFDVKGLKKLNKMYDEGYKMTDLAKIFNLHYTTIQKYIWNPRHKGPYRKNK